MAVNMQEIIKVSPTTPRPYPHMKCVIGSKEEDYYEEITRERALSILDAGYTLDIIKDGGVREALTKDYLTSTETTPAPPAAAKVEEVVKTTVDEPTEEKVTDVEETPVPKNKKK